MNRSVLTRPGISNTHLYAKVTPVYIVSKEEVTSCSRTPANFEQLHQIKKLTMNITTNCKIKDIKIMTWMVHIGLKNLATTWAHIKWAARIITT